MSIINLREAGFENPHTKAAQLLFNESVFDHTDTDAALLHGPKAASWFKTTEPLAIEPFIEDSFRGRLLADTGSAIISSFAPRDARLLGLRFGFYDDQVHSLDEIGRYFGLSRVRIYQLVHKNSRIIRRQFRQQIGVFSEDLDTVDLADALVTLPPIYPYRKK